MRASTHNSRLVAVLAAAGIACTGARHPSEPARCDQAIGSWSLAARWQPAPASCPALPWDRPLALEVARIVDSGNPHVFADMQPMWGDTRVHARELSAVGDCEFELAFADDDKPGTTIEGRVTLAPGGAGALDLAGPDPSCRVRAELRATRGP